ncbi:unnamed protein product [Rangifer tarandus platyrhynchus]|uniref:Uncharacterized protein n=1 Tax=Rangifer tarandus platyrhynchus TaxID=3082113 RepID=A0ABN8YWD9_RANTA|nr:unnamed protein product [Rangifer tarandus platyrhynchus]
MREQAESIVMETEKEGRADMKARRAGSPSCGHRERAGNVRSAPRHGATVGRPERLCRTLPCARSTTPLSRKSPDTETYAKSAEGLKAAWGSSPETRWGGAPGSVQPFGRLTVCKEGLPAAGLAPSPPSKPLPPSAVPVCGRITRLDWFLTPRLLAAWPDSSFRFVCVNRDQVRWAETTEVAMQAVFPMWGTGSQT